MVHKTIMNYSKITLGEMLSSPNEAIKRNAIGIMKQYQKCPHNEGVEYHGQKKCLKCGAVSVEYKKNRYSVYQ